MLELDHLSFDGFWRLDADGLTNAIEATPSSRFRVAGRATTGCSPTRSPVAPASTATSSGSPSIPTCAARATAAPIVLDGLRWLRRHGATQALVNTQRDNAPALALYESCGFRELPAGLCVMGRSL